MASIRKDLSLAADSDRSRFVWIVDVLPDAIAPYIEDMMTRGAAVMKARLEQKSAMP